MSGFGRRIVVAPHMNNSCPTNSTSQHGCSLRRATTTLALCLGLVLGTSAAYFRVFSNEFVDFDDGLYITANPFVQSGLNSTSVQYAVTTFDSGNWIPLTWLSWELDAQLFGVSSTAFHASNLILHIANCIMLYGWLRWTTGSQWRSFAVAAFFAVHPLHVESVAWASERKDVLCTFWLLITLFAYVSYCTKPNRVRYFLVACSFGFGLLAKSMLVTLPILLLLVDAWPLQRIDEPSHRRNSLIHDRRCTWPQLLVEKTPLLLMSFADGLICIAAQRSVSAMSGIDEVSLGVRTQNAIYAMTWYLSKTICPTNLCVFYSLPVDSLSLASICCSAAVLLSLMTWIAFGGRRRKHLCFGGWWFVLSILPVIGLLQTGSQAYADRYTYIPHLGLLTAIVWELHYQLSGSRMLRSIMIGTVAVTVTAGALLTYRQTAYWHDSEALWNRVLALDKNSNFGHYNLGSICQREGRLAEALTHLDILLKQYPNSPELLNNFGLIHRQRGEFVLAAEFYRRALRANPRDQIAQRNLASLMQESPQTIVDGGRIPVLPDAVARNRNGLTYARNNQLDLALKEFLAATEISQDYADAYCNAGTVLVHLGRNVEAKSSFARALAINPDHAASHSNLASLLEADGQLDEARSHFEAALRLTPNDPELRRRLDQLKRPSLRD